MVDIFLPIRKFAGLNESKAGPTLAQMIKQILKGAQRLVAELDVQGFKMADMRGWGSKARPHLEQFEQTLVGYRKVQMG